MPNHLTTLRDHPDIAREVGLFVADYAALEILLCEIFALLSHLPPKEAFSQFFSLRSINKKTEKILSEGHRLPQEFQIALKRITRRMKGAASRRTEIAHVLFMAGESGIHRLQLTGEKAMMIPLTDAFFERTLSQYHTLATDLLTLAATLSVAAPHKAKAIKSEINDPINSVLQRKAAPPGQTARLGADALDAARERLGLTAFYKAGLQLRAARQQQSEPHPEESREP